jgi:hypothetical protein
MACINFFCNVKSLPHCKQVGHDLPRRALYRAVRVTAYGNEESGESKIPSRPSAWIRRRGTGCESWSRTRSTERLVLHSRGHRPDAGKRTSSRRGGPWAGREGGDGSCTGGGAGIRCRRQPSSVTDCLGPRRLTRRKRPAGEVIPATRQECADGHPADSAHRPRAHSPEEELEHLVLSDGMRFALGSAR